MKKVTIDPQEVAKFEQIANEWWDENGKFKPLHKFNPVRINFIKGMVDKPLKGLEILDIGCGGGLVAEPLARLGAKITGIDATEKNIKTASVHAEKEGLKINYLASSVEELPKNKKYDVILALEIIEHVANPEFFLKECTKHLKKDGLIFVATINKTLKSLVLAKYTAEYVLGWLPRGTHDWHKFLRPSEIVEILENEKLELKRLTGVKLNLLKNSWQLSSDLSQNYIACFKN